MGYIKHHAIIVTADEANIKILHKTAVSIFSEQVSSIVCSPVQATYSFLVGPDGSKEGWDESDIGDAKRRQFIEYLERQDDPHNADRTYNSYVELFYGEDNGYARVERHN